MSNQLLEPEPTPYKANWFSLTPSSWRTDLLLVLLRVTVLLGTIVGIPSIIAAIHYDIWSVAVLDTVALASLATLLWVTRLPTKLRIFGTVIVWYALGVGLLINVGPISQIFLVGFAIFATVLLSLRWGLVAVVLNTATILVLGEVGAASPAMTHNPAFMETMSWGLITANFMLVNVLTVVVVGAVINVLESAVKRSTTVQASLERGRALLRIAGKAARLGGWSVELATGELAWSDETKDILHYPSGPPADVENALNFYTPESQKVIGEALGKCIHESVPYDLEAEVVTGTSQQIWVRIIGQAFHNADNVVTHVQGSIQDITPQKQAEARNQKLEVQLLHAQKMEAVGGLAGGIAHDFNNLLTVVLSYTELILDELPEDSPLRSDVQDIRTAGLRASELTSQLLAFSRRQVRQPAVIDLNDVLLGLEKILSRMIGEHIQLTLLTDSSARKIEADPSQIEQIILNLIVNSCDAMPEGGKLTIETASITLDKDYASEHVGVVPGEYVMLAVTDTGTGMDRPTQARIFEPFFTTKDKNKGTGLGLSMVYGIVQQSGGHLWVYSELGAGTTIKLYLPRTDKVQSARFPALTDPSLLRGTETILLVEDEDLVREVICTILRRQGYNVLETKNGGEAFLLCEQYTASIHVLLTDVVMPRMSGRQLAERVRPLRPEMKVLYISGYTENTIVHHGVLEAGISFLAKPIMPDALLRKLRHVIDTD